MDPSSNMMASQAGVDKETSNPTEDFNKLCENIDYRHKLQYGNLEYKSGGKDAIDVSSFEKSMVGPEQQPQQAPHPDNDLDAVRKGKGKGGWAANGSKVDPVAKWSPISIDG